MRWLDSRSVNGIRGLREGIGNRFSGREGKRIVKSRSIRTRHDNFGRGFPKEETR